MSKRIIKLAITNRFVNAHVFPWTGSINEDATPLATSSSRDLPADSVQKKMNRADKDACILVAKHLSQQLQQSGVETVQLAGAPRYHGRVKAFLELHTMLPDGSHSPSEWKTTNRNTAGTTKKQNQVLANQGRWNIHGVLSSCVAFRRH